jgi:hypothetical protein
MRLILKPELFNLLNSYDYKLVMQGLHLFIQQCSDNMAKLNLIELSDIMIKW